MGGGASSLRVEGSTVGEAQTLTREITETPPTFASASRPQTERRRTGTTPGGRAASSWCRRDAGSAASEALGPSSATGSPGSATATPSLAASPTGWVQTPETVEELNAPWLAWRAAYAEPDPHPAAHAE